MKINSEKKYTIGVSTVPSSHFESLRKNPESKKRIMTKKQVYRFVMHYERITRYIMKEIPFIADIVLERDEEFNFSIIKTP